MNKAPDYILNINDIFPLNNYIEMPNGSKQYNWYIKRSENEFEDVTATDHFTN